MIWLLVSNHSYLFIATGKKYSCVAIFACIGKRWESKGKLVAQPGQ